MGSIVVRILKKSGAGNAQSKYGLFYVSEQKEAFIDFVEDRYVKAIDGKPTIQCQLTESENMIILCLYLPSHKWDNPDSNILDLPVFGYYASDDEGSTWENIKPDLRAFSGEVLPSRIGAKYYQTFMFSTLEGAPYIYFPPFVYCFINGKWDKSAVSRDYWSENSCDLSWVLFEITFPNLFYLFLEYLETRLNAIPSFGNENR